MYLNWSVQFHVVSKMQKWPNWFKIMQNHCSYNVLWTDRYNFIFYGIMLIGDLFPARSSARDLWVSYGADLVNWLYQSERYRAAADHTRVSTAPDEVPYPIEPTRSVLGRHTTVFQIGPREPGIEVTWWRARRRRPKWSCFARHMNDVEQHERNGRAVWTL